MARPPLVTQEQAFALLSQAWPLLGAYQKRIVLVGGLAKLAYTHHPLFRMPDYGAPPTTDVDLALPFPLEEMEGSCVLDRLSAGGLRVDHGTGDADAITRIFATAQGNPSNAAYIEFLTPSAGRDKRMEGQPQPALRAHVVTSARLLLAHPETIEMPGLGPVPVPHPLAYGIQKTYIRISKHSQRPPAKRAKDQADMLFVLSGFRERWDEMAAHWRQIHNDSHEMAVWSDQVLELWRHLYARPDAEGPTEVVATYRSILHTTIDPVAIHAIMAAFLRQLSRT